MENEEEIGKMELEILWYNFFYILKIMWNEEKSFQNRNLNEVFFSFYMIYVPLWIQYMTSNSFLLYSVNALLCESNKQCLCFRKTQWIRKQNTLNAHYMMVNIKCDYLYPLYCISWTEVASNNTFFVFDCIFRILKYSSGSNKQIICKAFFSWQCLDI